jgi:REP element-mobilizing transposase RayT
MAWVLMPDHVHWMLQLGESMGLGEAVNRLKSASARRLNRRMGQQGTIWARAFHDRALRREDDLKVMARYLVANPVRAGLVERVGDYPFWDAVWL